MTRASLFLAACLAVSTAARPAFAAESPFEPGLMRLAEVLGSLHFLRNLCGEKGDAWRAEMEKLLQSENPDPDRRARFTPIAATRWRAEPHIHGSYSHAHIGAAPQRAILAAPVDDRLFFAGEACSRADFSTAHGAFETGVAAAEAVIAQFAAPAALA